MNNGKTERQLAGEATTGTDHSSRPRPTQTEVDQGVPGVGNIPDELLPPGVVRAQMQAGSESTASEQQGEDEIDQHGCFAGEGNGFGMTDGTGEPRPVVNEGKSTL